MSGEGQRHHESVNTAPIPAGATKREAEDRTGHYGGDDGALEHERTEIAAADTPTNDDQKTRAKQRQASVQ